MSLFAHQLVQSRRMEAWLGPLAAVAVCVMDGSPVIWSSLPVLTGLTLISLAVGRPRPPRDSLHGFRIAWLSSLAFVAISGVIAIVRLDLDGVVAFVGGSGSLVCGYLLGVRSGLKGDAVSRLLLAISVGYVFHAIVLLIWFLERTGWDLVGAIYLRWDIAAIESASTHGFGNLGNNAVLAGMLLPALLVAATRRCSWVLQAWSGAAALLAISVLILTQARASLLSASIVAVLLFVAFRLRWQLALLAAAFIGFAALPSFESPGIEINTVTRLASSLTSPSADRSFSERLEAIIEGIGLLSDHASMGIGVARLPLVMNHTAPHQWHLHQALEWGVAAGILSMLATVAVWWALIQSLWRSWHRWFAFRDVAICLSIPGSYVLTASMAGAQWHFGMASVWPALCGICFGVAWAMAGSERTRRNDVEPKGSTASSQSPLPALISRPS